jgi:hypothetical protein
MVNEKEEFEQMLGIAIKNVTDEPPQDAEEFDIYVDTHYNVYMFIKNEWQNTGLNVTLLKESYDV